MRWKALLLAAIASTSLLAGCITGSEEPETETIGPAADVPEEIPEELPDGREFAAAKETNKTEQGLGGKSHTHDYWLGDTKVTIFDQVVRPGLAPVFWSREDTSQANVAFVSLDSVPGQEDRPALVYEGTGLVEFTVHTAPPWLDTIEIVYRTAATDWSQPIPLKVGETWAYEPTMYETDMPHSTRSLWNWAILAGGPVPVTGAFLADETSFHVTINVHKVEEVKDWPGHPAFYDGVKARVVMDNQQGRTSVQTVGDILLYGVEPDNLVPEKLISMGTRTLDVYVNITRLDSPLPPAGFSLWWHSADIPPWRNGFAPNANETDSATFAYWHIRLDDDQLDAPYQPTSRFYFKVLMNPGDQTFARCYRCVPYTVEYTMTIVAKPDPEAVPATMDA